MAKVSPIQSNFSGGEFSPLLDGRVDAPSYESGLDLCQNYIPTLQGGLNRRSGTKFIAEVSDSSKFTRLYRFEYSVDQAYQIEFGENYIRFYENQGQLTESATTITGITQANPAVVSITAHGYSNGEEVYISGVAGMTEVNGKNYKVSNVTANTFELQDMDSVDVDSTSYTAYSADGSAYRVYTVTSTYTEAELPALKFTQSADVLYIVHPDHPPATLSRAGSTNWTLADMDFADGPYFPTNTAPISITPSSTVGTITLTASASLFASTDVGRLVRINNTNTIGYAQITVYTSATVVTASVKSPFENTSPRETWELGLWSETTGYPSAVTFHENRLAFAGAAGDPQRVDLSNTGVYSAFTPTDYATPFAVSDDRAMSFNFSSSDINAVRWLLSEDKGLLVGTTGGEWLVRPSSVGEALTPANITAKRSTSYGSADIQALQAGRSTLFVQRAQRKVRELAYFFESEGHEAADITLVAEHITSSGITGFALQKEPQPVVWVTKTDGQLIGMTFERSESGLNAAWHRHVLGGQVDASGLPPEVESVSVIPSGDGFSDELWLVVKREINGTTRRFIELLTPAFDDETDQKDAFFVDSGLTYDVPLTISGATMADPVVITSTAHGLSNGDKVLISGVRGMSELNTNSYLVANQAANTFEITDLDGNDIDGTAFTEYVSGGEVRKYVTTIAGLHHLEGETVSILGDGAVQPSRVVTDGAITLQVNATTIHIGLGYASRGKMLRLDKGSANGTAIGKTRRMSRVGIMLHRSLGLKIGMSFDDLTELTFRTSADKLSRAPELFTGILSETVEADYDYENQFCWEQSQPLPSTLLALMPIMVTQDDR